MSLCYAILAVCHTASCKGLPSSLAVSCRNRRYHRCPIIRIDRSGHNPTLNHHLTHTLFNHFKSRKLPKPTIDQSKRKNPTRNAQFPITSTLITIFPIFPIFSTIDNHHHHQPTGTIKSNQIKLPPLPPRPNRHRNPLHHTPMIMPHRIHPIINRKVSTNKIRAHSRVLTRQTLRVVDRVRLILPVVDADRAGVACFRRCCCCCCSWVWMGLRCGGCCGGWFGLVVRFWPVAAVAEAWGWVLLLGVSFGCCCCCCCWGCLGWVGFGLLTCEVVDVVHLLSFRFWWRLGWLVGWLGWFGYRLVVLRCFA